MMPIRAMFRMLSLLKENYQMSLTQRSLGSNTKVSFPSQLEDLCEERCNDFVCWWHVENNWVSPRNIFGVKKYKSAAENSGLLGAQWLFSRSFLALILQNAFATCALDAPYWTNTPMVIHSLSYRKAYVFVYACVCVCEWGLCVYVHASHPHVLSLGPVFCTYGWSEMKLRREFE